MREFRHLNDVTTLRLDQDKCIGCGLCTEVCPHGVLVVEERKARVVDLDGCMECGACANNCPEGALHVTPGVGCAAYIVMSWIKGRKAAEEKYACG